MATTHPFPSRPLSSPMDSYAPRGSRCRYGQAERVSRETPQRWLMLLIPSPSSQTEFRSPYKPCASAKCCRRHARYIVLVSDQRSPLSLCDISIDGRESDCWRPEELSASGRDGELCFSSEGSSFWRCRQTARGGELSSRSRGCWGDGAWEESRCPHSPTLRRAVSPLTCTTSPS